MIDTIEKSPMWQLQYHLDKHFKTQNPVSLQRKDKHITVEVAGDIRIWNNLNMRYTHRLFQQISGTAAEDALAWLQNDYNGQAQPIPEEWAVQPAQVVNGCRVSHHPATKKGVPVYGFVIHPNHTGAGAAKFRSKIEYPTCAEAITAGVLHVQSQYWEAVTSNLAAA
jgi:hypothetical protein